MVFSSRDGLLEFMGKLPWGGAVLIEPRDCPFILEKSSLNVILSEDGFTKTFFAANIVDYVLGEGTVVYVDLDTIFTAFLNTMIHDSENLDNLLIFQPDEQTVEKTMAQVCSLSSPYLKFIVLDSMTTLYHLFDGKGPSDVNRKVSIYLSLLQSMSKRFDIPVLVTSMMRARRMGQTGPRPWLTSPTGGRALLRAKIVLKLSKTSSHINIDAIKHNETFIGKTFKLPLRVEWSTH